ncbi:hypothetical protein FA15DRAFT_620457 [Coprinopsis marcescibilis]|uniref:Uncharacterized protein n=1 Tax=Coprinopsis marcescibilis TaxID=230819 RepID=A0A5C3KTC6_COPMA|nr:hypothetical protein FA15DRAFT_620457 [Coprinopsis marcescibilis]
MGAKFLFCLPLRLGVSIFTMGQFLVAGAIAGLAWFITFGPRNTLEWELLVATLRTGLIIFASIFSFISFVGLLGFFGAMFKKTALVSIYVVVLWFSYFIQLAGGIWFIVQFFKLRNLGALDRCDDEIRKNGITFGDLTVDLNDVCDALEKLNKAFHPAVIIGVFVAINIILLYVIYIGHAFIGRLKDKKYEKVYGGGTAIPSYAPVKQAENIPLTVQGSYPYTDASNSFGHAKAPSTGYAPVGASRV